MAMSVAGGGTRLVIQQTTTMEAMRDNLHIYIRTRATERSLLKPSFSLNVCRSELGKALGLIINR